MLFYTFYYLVTALLLFQGTHLLGEQASPMGTVPSELALAPEPSRGWGRTLVGMALVCLIAGLISHGICPWFTEQPLVFLEGAAWLVMAAYGFWLIFIAKRIEYVGAAAPVEHGHH